MLTSYRGSKIPSKQLGKFHGKGKPNQALGRKSLIFQKESNRSVRAGFKQWAAPCSSLPEMF